jgi:two-component system, NtrC family, nitrogen regulation response regulator NtrX
MAELILVDDDEDVRDVLAEFVRMEGHDVRVAENGYAGLLLLNEKLPDLALLDVEMPELTGPEMAYRMFVEDCGREFVPIVFLSGAVDLEQIAASVGTTYYLPKPFSLDALRSMLNRALHERAAPTYPRSDEQHDFR